MAPGLSADLSPLYSWPKLAGINRLQTESWPCTVVARAATTRSNPNPEGKMLNLSRREFVASTAIAAALGLNARLVLPAFAQKTPDPAKPFVTYQIGSAEVTA